MDDTYIEVMNESKFPNPTDQSITIKSQHNKGIISIYNLSGQEFFRQQRNLKRTKINLGQLPTEMYILKIEFEQQIILRKFIKN